MKTLSQEKKRAQICIYGLDPSSRLEFKKICKKMGYPVNEVLLQMIDQIVKEPQSLKRLFHA